MKRVKYALVIFLGVLLAQGLSAQTQEDLTITLNVPIRLENLHQDVDRFAVDSYLIDRNGHAVMGTVHQVATFEAPADGNFNQDVELVFPVTQNQYNEAVRYRVELIIRCASPGGSEYNCSKDQIDYNSENGIGCRPAEGTNYTVEVGGDIPK